MDWVQNGDCSVRSAKIDLQMLFHAEQTPTAVLFTVRQKPTTGLGIANAQCNGSTILLPSCSADRTDGAVLYARLR